MFYVKLYVYSLVDKLKYFYENARSYNKIYKWNTFVISKLKVLNSGEWSRKTIQMSLSGYSESSINSVRTFSCISDGYSKLKITTYDIN